MSLSIATITKSYRQLTLRYQWLAYYLLFSLLAAGLFVLSLRLATNGFPYLLHLVGLVVFFIPGLTITLAVEQLVGAPQSLFRLFLWGFICSLTFNPTAIFILGQQLDRPAMTNVLFLFSIWWLAVLGILTIFYMIKASPTGLTFPRFPTYSRSVLWVMLVSLGVLAIHFILYPYIPEVDGYANILSVERLNDFPKELNSEPRFLYLLLTQILSVLSAISPYWLYKLVLPLFNLVPLLVLLRISQPIKIAWLRWLLVLSLFSAPVVVEEMVITRPQSIFFLTLLPICYLLGKYSLERRPASNIFWLVTLAAVVVLGSGIHGMFILVASLIPCAILVYYWQSIKRSPLDAVIVGLAVLIAIYPWLAKLDFLGFIMGTGQLVINIIRESHFEFWFIDNYTNVDGNSIGWPGWSSLYYYGYNTGLFLPVGIGVALWLAVRVRNISPRPWVLSWPIIGALLIFFAVAEIFPRFGFAYLPDRAWLFISALTPIVLMFVYQFIGSEQLTRQVRILLIGSLVLSIVGGWLTTYLKQGWVNRNEYKTLPFIQKELPENSLILTQSGNRVLIKYFARRYFLAPPGEVFYDTDISSLDTFVRDTLSEDPTQKIEQSPADIESKRRDSRQSINELLSSFYVTTDANSSLEVIKQLEDRLKEYSKLVIKVDQNDANQSVKIEKERDYKTPIYLLYSFNRFNGLYGMRDWWLKSNFQGANLDKFTENYPLIYDQDGVMIWEIRK